MLLGTTVKNSGTISTPDGQTIMGAGTTVYLASTTDPAMRGLLIAVDGQQLAANSTATNEGTITAARGNVTIAGPGRESIGHHQRHYVGQCERLDLSRGR